MASPNSPQQVSHSLLTSSFVKAVSRYATLLKSANKGICSTLIFGLSEIHLGSVVKKLSIELESAFNALAKGKSST